MIWALLLSLAIADEDPLAQAQAELAALIAETEDPELERRLLAIHAQVAIARGQAAAQEPPPPKPEPQAEPPAPVAGAEPPCTPEEYDKLRAKVDDAAFSRDKLSLLEKASARLSFSVEQVVGLMDVLDFGSDKVKAAAILHPRVVDPEDFGQVYDALVFDTDREALRAMVEEDATQAP